MNRAEIARLATGWWRPTCRLPIEITVHGTVTPEQAQQVVWWLIGRHAKN
jgi:hypothetical protein